MLALASAVFGFLAPFLPEAIKYFNAKVANAHELAILQLQAQTARDAHTWRMEEINAQADIAEAQTLRAATPSFGAQLLDAAKGHNLSQWLFVPAFYGFAMLDFIAGITRPGITWCAFGLYVAVKAAMLWIGFHLARDPVEAAQGIVNVWSDFDQGLLQMVLSYWFGERVRKAVFGGTAGTTAPGK